MIKIEEYNEIKVLAGGGVKPFMYQVPNVRFHTSLSGKVSDYKIGCAEILRLFIGRNLYHAHSVHMNKQREDKVNYEEPSLGEFLRTYKIGSGDIDNLLPYITEYDAEDYGCGLITNVFLEIANPEIGKKFNVGFNNESTITTIFSTPINKEASQANNSKFKYNYANTYIVKYTNEYKSTGEISNEFMGKIISFVKKDDIKLIIEKGLHEPYKSKFDKKYKEMKNFNKLNQLMFDL